MYYEETESYQRSSLFIERFHIKMSVRERVVSFIIDEEELINDLLKYEDKNDNMRRFKIYAFFYAHFYFAKQY